MKWVIAATLLFAFVCALAPASARAQDIFQQQSQPITAAAPAYTPDVSLDQIRSDIDREAKNETSPSKHVLYDDSNDATPPSPQSSSSNAPSVANAQGLAGVFANYFPTAGGRAGIAKYLSIVQPQSYTSDKSVGTANNGIVAWFDKELNGNACVQRRAVDFYTAVGQFTERIPSPTSGLSRNIQSESQNRLKPGWLWKLAMRSSGGDTGLALTLIGLCGHDDHAQGGANDSSFTFRDDSEAARSVIANKLTRFADVKNDLQEQIQKPTVQSKRCWPASTEKSQI